MEEQQKTLPEHFHERHLLRNAFWNWMPYKSYLILRELMLFLGVNPLPLPSDESEWFEAFQQDFHKFSYSPAVDNSMFDLVLISLMGENIDSYRALIETLIVEKSTEKGFTIGHPKNGLRGVQRSDFRRQKKAAYSIRYVCLYLIDKQGFSRKEVSELYQTSISHLGRSIKEAAYYWDSKIHPLEKSLLHEVSALLEKIKAIQNV